MGLADLLLNQNIDTIQSVTIDGRGNKTASTVYSNVRCRWSPSTKRVLDRDNELSSTAVECWIPADYDIEYNYQIVKDSTTYRILRIEKKYNLYGQLDHIKLYLV
jgi:hypothetical protein